MGDFLIKVAWCVCSVGDVLIKVVWCVCSVGAVLIKVVWCVCSVGDVRGKFREYDKKKRGYITTDEALPILKRDLGFDESKTETLLYMFDKNNDYRLSLLEFIDFQRKVEELWVLPCLSVWDVDFWNISCVTSHAQNSPHRIKGWEGVIFVCFRLLTPLHNSSPSTNSALSFFLFLISFQVLLNSVWFAIWTVLIALVMTRYPSNREVIKNKDEPII